MLSSTEQAGLALMIFVLMLGMGATLSPRDFSAAIKRPKGILIGMLSGLASIVPYLGFFVGIIAATIAALFQFQEPIYLLYVAMVFGVGQALEGWVLTPWLVGDKIGLHPVAVIFAVLAGGQLFGFVGILLALPVAAVIMVFVRHLHGSYIQSDYYFRRDDSG